MKTKTVTYSKVFPLGGYSNEKIGVEIEVEETDDVQIVIQRARAFVEYNHKLNGLSSEREQCEQVIQNPDDFTGNQIKMAKKRLDEINEAITSGTRLLKD